ncbi:hypothetical protein CY34DRAFT_799228 [Suillus luteus UH-Slu-Lm8-n1]|uniref:Unplaced genomic scaffold CY34scaffold_15, whole genome shotgun sequence n=1 Tax=Suillus luteus UH-Slu-Lm8-n1 TaxID=930992 RepID=A0A0D0BCM7_9AGAM|nr:hypothetical protein CY34DRAFT_799228 [Suillus luteus UH-Slu-Lm8-n1]
MLLSTFPTVTIFQSTFTGYQNETHIAAVGDDLAPTTAETCFSCAIKCQCDSGAIRTTANDTPCFQFAAEESPLQTQVNEPKFAFSPDLSASMMEDSSGPLSSELKTSPSSKKISLLHVKFPTKRPSLQSLLTPPFFQSSTSPSSSASRARSLSAATLTHNAAFEEGSNIPIPAASSTLLDEDPFANLRSSPSVIPSSECPSSYSNPSVPLHPPRSSAVLLPSQAYLQHHNPKRPKSSGHGQVRPAHTRPAFSPRPSLPSLYTLAQMNIGIPRKPRKGTPGARLPHEPWDMDPPASSAEPIVGPSQRQRAATVPQAPEPSVTRQDFVFSSEGTPSPACSSTSEKIPTDSDEPESSSHSTNGRPASVQLDDAEIDSLPSLSFTGSEPSSSALSRSSSISSSSWSATATDQNSISVSRVQGSEMSFAHEIDGIDEDHPLSYHSDFDYYTQPHSDYSESDWESPSKVKSGTPYPEVTPTPYTSFYSPETSSDLARSFRTMPGILQYLPDNKKSHPSPRLEDAPRDGDGTPEQRGPPPGRDRDEDSRSHAYGGREERDHAGNHSSGGYGHGSGGGGGGGDDGDRGRRPSTRSPAWSDSDYSSSSDEGDNGTVYYSVDGHSSRPPSRTRSVRSRMVPCSDDDVPLAQSMPMALTAQKSIRRQLRDERHQRKMQRAKGTRAVIPPERPPVPVLPPVVMHGRQRSASVTPSLAPSRGEKSRGRPTPLEPFPVDDLAMKLANLQFATPPSTAPPSYNGIASASLSARVPISGSGPRIHRPQAVDEMVFLQHAPAYTTDKLPQDRQLRSMRSFHRPERRTVDTTQPHIESSSSQRLGRKPTIASRRPEDPPVRRDKSVTRPSRDGFEVRNASDPLLRSARPSEDSRRPTPTVPRVSVDQDIEQRGLQRLPVELIHSRSQPLPMPKVQVTQQRVFIGDMQRFNTVEITPNTNAGDVIALIASQGSLDHTAVWMLFELANDFGMERPIRSYELLSDVTASWNKDKLLNAFVVKRTYLAPFLSRSNIPTSSPTNRGYVEYESKKGKWSKRWMELREHSLWLAKRDTGKDETFLCSLSNFDAYYITRKHKSPKPFVFAIKSTDNISLFENVSDYVHILSCNQKDGERWMEAILVARSYVLFQERHVLFAKPGESTSISNNLSRSQTRKQSISTRPSQPLVSVSAPFSASATAAVTFEPGSLLAKHKGDVMS